MADRIIDRRGGFGTVQRIVTSNPAISAQAKGLYAHLACYAGGSDTAFPGQKRLAEEMGATEKTVRTWIQEIQDHGVLEVRREKTHGACYRCSYIFLPLYAGPDPAVSDDPPRGKPTTPGDGSRLPPATVVDYRVRVTNKINNKDKQYTPSQKAATKKLTPSQQIAKDTLWAAWQDEYHRVYSIPYKPTAGDWPQVYARNLLDLPQDRIRALVSAWFSAPEKERRYYPHHLRSFAAGFERAETLIKKTDDCFTTVRGWGEGAGK